MFLEFQVRVINILTFQKTVLCPGDRQRVAARSVHKGTPIFCHCRHFYFALFRALSLAGDPWFTFAASLLSCVAIGLMDECAPAMSWLVIGGSCLRIRHVSAMHGEKTFLELYPSTSPIVYCFTKLRRSRSSIKADAFFVWIYTPYKSSV